MKAVLIAAIGICSMFFSCEQDGYGPKVKAKVVYGSCAVTVVQVLDPAHYQLGEPSWQHSPSEPVFQNVFTVKNKCSFGRRNIAIGQEFYFRLTKDADNDCVICMMADHSPAMNHAIAVVGKE